MGRAVRAARSRRSDRHMCKGFQQTMTMSLVTVRIAARVVIAVVAGSLLVLVPARVFAQQSGVINACVLSTDDRDRNAGDGWLVRIIEATEACGRGEERIQWNVAGPQGSPGLNGAPGIPGPPGPAGPAGAQG